MTAPDLGAELSLAGRTALVAGGSGGIGAEIVRWFVAAGARVFSADLPNHPVPEGAVGIACDLSDPSSCANLWRTFHDQSDRLDVLVHSAGITRDGVVWKMSDEDWSRVLAVNLDSAFRLVRGAALVMRAHKRGAIILISSINGERGKFGQSNYAAAKAGLIGLARSAARELGRSGVRVNVIAPGMVRTSMTEKLAEEHVARAREEAALGRIAEPEDVARVALFLACDLAQHVTGQVLRVDGGQLMA